MTNRVPGLIVQPRDDRVLTKLASYRVLTSEHLHHLVFPDVSERMGNRRLKLLFDHRFVERHHLPDIEGGVVVRSRRPLYSLTRLGADRVCEDLWPSVRFVPSPWAVTVHNLVATDLLVAVSVAATVRGLQAEVLPEPELRAKLARARRVGNRIPGGVLPDGVFTLTPPGGPPVSFCVEVVRSGAKGGNVSVLAKLRRYVALNREGFFREVYGLERLRGVLLVTTSQGRATRLVRLAEALPHGKGLIFATSYERKSDFAMTFDPATVLTLPLLHLSDSSSSIYSSTLIHLCAPSHSSVPAVGPGPR